MIRKNTKKWYLMPQKQFLDFLAFIGPSTVTSRREGEGIGYGMGNYKNKKQET